MTGACRVAAVALRGSIRAVGEAMGTGTGDFGERSGPARWGQHGDPDPVAELLSGYNLAVPSIRVIMQIVGLSAHAKDAKTAKRERRFRLSRHSGEGRNP